MLVSAPTVAPVSGAGSASHNAEGLFHEDVRVLSRLDIDVHDCELVSIAHERVGSRCGRFRGVLRGGAFPGPDATVSIEREIEVSPGSATLTVTAHNSGGQPARFGIDLLLDSDLATIEQVKTGQPTSSVVPTVCEGDLIWHGGSTTVTATVSPSPVAVDPIAGRCTFSVELEPGGTWACVLTVAVAQRPPALFLPNTAPLPWSTVRVEGDRDLAAFVATGLENLAALLLTDPGTTDRFVAAGAPWFLTLFGRDAIWTAEMLLPISTEIAGSTLRVLARRQGHVVDRSTEEQPGKILHELRRPSEPQPGGRGLPPRYYGTIDATPLWITLLVDAWKWGLPTEEVAALLEPAEAALRWMRDSADPDGDGLLEYIDESGKGLANQGWRDSYDAIRWRDGRLASAPIALCEVQAYAYRAATGGADLLEAFGRGGADEWRTWAARLKKRFDATFWLDGPLGPYPAVALDGEKQKVDSITSGLGHLLGTGLLDAEKEASVARYLSSSDLDSGLGLRTLSASSGGFNPLGYHTGSVWPHDTAIAARGLAAAGEHAAARSLIGGVIRAAASFDYRLPELFAGYDASAGSPVPYPAACSPQAWSAAAALSVLQTTLGLRPDVPAGTVAVSPIRAAGEGPFAVRGLRVAGHPLGIDIDATGHVNITTSAPVVFTPSPTAD